MEFTVGDTLSVNDLRGKVVEIYMTNSSGQWLPWIRIKLDNGCPIGMYGDHESIVRNKVEILERIPRT